MENVKNPRRIEIIDDEIAIFAPSAHQAVVDQVMYYSDDQALSHYEPHDQSLRFSKSAKNAETIWKILSADFTADFDLFPEFLALINPQETQPSSETETSAEPTKNPKRVEIIGNEIALFTTDEDQASMHFEVSNFRFEHLDTSWRFSKTAENAETIWGNLPVDYELSDEFRLLVMDCGF